ncbi:MAG: sulfatase-like hydrolase/transferase [Candidatus Anammoximicrobium sp.]|nr:sulfatase-like hydrolase/transferase [Candidatus Anammoximicrobium sp.]
MWSRRIWTVVIVVTIAVTAGLWGHLWAQIKKAPSGPGGTPPRSQAERKPGDDEESLKDALVRKLKEALDSADDVADEDRDTADRILRDADRALTRIREENRRALEQMNRQVRIKDGRSPNVVLFLLHDVGYGDLGCYGQQTIETPMIDLIAAYGTRFTQFYAGAPESVASRGTLLSGKLTARGRQVGDAWVTVRPEDSTLAEMLFQGGYETGLFGVWGAGPVEAAGHPNSQGFKTFFGYLDDASAADYYPAALWQNGTQIPLAGNQNGGKAQYAPDLIVESAKRFIDAKAKRPFLMVIAFPMALSGDGTEVPDFGPYADKDWPTADKARAAMLTRVDGYVGQIVSRLQERRLLSRTITIVTSDNGPPQAAEDRFLATAGLRGRKGDLYEGGIRVPLVVRWSSCFRMDCCECALPFGMWDALPTLVDLTGTLRRPRAIDGASIVRRLTAPANSESPPPASPLYWERHVGEFAQAARVDNWKAVRSGTNGRWELFDLKTDVGESKDLADSQPEVVQRIEQTVKGLRP